VAGTFFSLTPTLWLRAADHIHRELRAREDGSALPRFSGSARFEAVAAARL
jgi:hypothetical protein